ncbi:hypothetical protein HS7_13040 [Sulfolobales archaeon HS-7]|nr:hypothetical protein HS7_13040 [Sulfolobales archaeon HS-7]
MRESRGISLAIFMVLMLIVLLSIIVPALFILQLNPYFNTQGQISSQGYSQLKSIQLNNLYRGNPNIYYNSSTQPYLEIKYSSSPIPFNISDVYYYNGESWVAILTQPVTIDGNTNYPLPSKAFNMPIILITGEANVLFLNPNTSVTTVSISGPAGKIPVIVTAFALNKTKGGINYIPLNVNFQLSSADYRTTAVLYVNPGTYPISALESPVSILNDGLTAVFKNWSINGNAVLSASNAQSTYVTITGETILTINYCTVLKKYSVNFVAGVPLNGESQTLKGASITSVNTSIPVVIDGNQYQLSSSGLTLQLTYGYHRIDVASYENITFNYNYNGYAVSEGAKVLYRYTGPATLSPGNINVVSSYCIFVTGNGEVNLTFNQVQVYYRVEVENNFYFPNDVTVESNSSPVTGDISGQLLQVTCNGGTFDWGPIKNYQPEILYLNASTNVNIQICYLDNQNGQYNINGRTYQCLLSEPTSLEYVSPAGTNTIGVTSTITVNSPITLIMYQEWKYGGSVDPGYSPELTLVFQFIALINILRLRFDL